MAMTIIIEQSGRQHGSERTTVVKVPEALVALLERLVTALEK